MQISMDPDFFITVLHVPDGPHFSKSGAAMVVPVVAGAAPLAHTCTCTSFKAVNPLIGDKPLGHPNKDIIIIICKKGLLPTPELRCGEQTFLTNHRRSRNHYSYYYYYYYYYLRVDKQECATPDLSCTICRYPRPRRNLLLTSPFFRRTRILLHSSVRARAGHRLCSANAAKCTRENFPKDSERVRRRKDYVNKNSAVGQPIRELHTLVYLLLLLLLRVHGL